MDKYDKMLLNLAGKVADRVSDTTMTIIVSIAFVVAAFFS